MKRRSLTGPDQLTHSIWRSHDGRRALGDERIQDGPHPRLGDGGEQHDPREMVSAKLEERMKAGPRKATDGVRNQRAFEVERQDADWFVAQFRQAGSMASSMRK
jgi:hypothetical protein